MRNYASYLGRDLARNNRCLTEEFQQALQAACDAGLAALAKGVSHGRIRSPYLLNICVVGLPFSARRRNRVLQHQFQYVLSVTAVILLLSGYLRNFSRPAFVTYSTHQSSSSISQDGKKVKEASRNLGHTRFFFGSRLL
jgi:hypothetical protein